MSFNEGGPGGGGARRPFFRRRKTCPFSGANAPKIDYKDVRLLQRYISERGKIAKVEYWGVKSLTYRIRKNRKAHFTLLNVEAPPAALAEVERQEHINEDVLRALTVRVDEHEAGPSAMMRKADRDRDRDERRGERRRDRDGPRGPREDRAEEEAEPTEH